MDSRRQSTAGRESNGNDDSVNSDALTLRSKPTSTYQDTKVNLLAAEMTTGAILRVAIIYSENCERVFGQFVTDSGMFLQAKIRRNIY